MRTTLSLVVVGMALTLSGCGGLESLHPLFTANDLVFEPALVGTWKGEERTRFTFSEMNDHAYGLEVIDEGDTLKLEAHLVRLHEFLFLDVAFAKPEVKAGSYTLLPAPHLTRAGDGVFLRPVPLNPRDPSGD